MLRLVLALSPLALVATPDLPDAPTHDALVASPMPALANVDSEVKYKKPQNSRIKSFKITGRSTSQVTISTIPATSFTWNTGQGYFKVQISVSDLITLKNTHNVTKFKVSNQEGDSVEIDMPALSN